MRAGQQRNLQKSGIPGNGAEGKYESLALAAVYLPEAGS